MRQSEDKVSLTRRAARAIESSWEEYQAFVSQSAVSVDVLARARELYDLAGAIQYDPDGWTDPMLDAAVLMLGTLGDGYLLASVEWPDGMPEGSLPDIKYTSWWFDECELRGWCAEQRDDGPIRREAEEVAEGHARGEKPLIHPDLEELRGHERPGGDSEESDAVIASELREWLPIYSNWLADIKRDSSEALLRLSAKRPVYAPHLAWVRQSLPMYFEHGGSGEGVAALSIIAALMRSLLLGGMAVDGRDLRRLHLAPANEIELVMQKFELHAWLERVCQ